MTRDEKVAALARSDPPRQPEDVQDWPETVPPFLTGFVMAGPDGRVWIRRTPTRNATGTDYDLVDRNGRLARRLRLAANEAIVGFGRAHAYVVATDDDGLQRLRRHSVR